MKFSSVLTTAISTLAATTVVALGFSSQALSLTISGDSRGSIWGQPDPGSNQMPTYTGVGTSSFTWGKPYNEGQSANKSNQLTFIGSSFSAELGSIFQIGEMHYYNGTVDNGTNVDSVPLSLRLGFTNPVNFLEDVKFDFYLENTQNVGIPEQDADSVMVKNTFGDRNLTDSLGNQYLLELIGFSQDGGNTTVSNFRVLEGERTTAGIFAQITRIPPSKTIPEPANIAALSVLGIYFVSRKNKFLKDKNK